jgi:PAS domain S-box-containing protein
VKRTLTLRTVGGAGLLALVIASLFFFMVGAIRTGSDATRQARTSADRIAAAIEEQKLAIDMETGLRGYLITGEKRFLAPWENAVDALPRTQGELSAAVQGDARAELLVRDIEADISDYIAEHARPLLTAVDAGRITPSRRGSLTSEGKRRIDHLRIQFRDLIASQRAAVAEARGAADAHSGRALLFGALGLVGSVLLVVMFCGYQLRFVLRPVRRVGLAARRLAEGDLSARVKERGSGEVGDLGRAFNAMADSLEHNRDELESQNSELEHQQAELERAVDELAQEKARIERLYRVGRAISSVTELEDVAQVVVDELGELAQAELGAVYVSARGGDAFICAAARGLDAPALPWVFPNIGLAGRAVAEKRMVTADLGESGVSIETLGAEMIGRHEVHLPLVSGSGVVGVVTLVRLRDTGFARPDLDVLEYLAGRAGAAIAAALTLREARDQAALTRAVLDTAADAFVSIDSNGVITAWNSAAQQMFGWTADEVIGMFLHETIVPERHRDRHERAVERIVAGGQEMSIEGVPVEFDARHRDGYDLPIEILISSLERGGEITFHAFIRDITARRRADRYTAGQYAVTRVLAEAPTLAEARVGVLEALGDALGWQAGTAWIFDESADVLRATAFWSADGVDASDLHRLTIGSTFDRGEGLPGRVWESVEPQWIEDIDRELTAPRADAAARAGLHGALAFPVASDSGFIGMVEFFSHKVDRPDPELLTMLANIGAQIAQFSERKRAEMEADRLKDEFFALVSHELRTPLTSIIGYLEIVLEEEGLVDPEGRRYLEVVERNSRRLHRLVGDLLFVAQVEAGRLSLDRTAIPIDRIVSDSVEAARPRAEENDVALRVRIDAAGTCNGDGDRLGQMLDNLISNAVKFTPEGGHVDVRFTRTGDRALIEVRDTGVGVPAGEQGRLFQRFFRSTTATERAIPGVGLGLTISRAIVEAHGGTIDFESEEGRGTTFRVELPLDAELSANDLSNAPQEVVL